MAGRRLAEATPSFSHAPAMTINLSSDWTCQADRAATVPLDDRRELADAGAFGVTSM